MRILALLCSLAASVFAPTGLAAQQGSPFPAVDTYLRDEAANGFSGSVLVARRGTVIERSFGLADREWNIPNSPTTRFRIGSLTKQFTAAAILMLAEDGKLSLDAPICNYLDACPESWRPIRVSQLLDHSSGLPDIVRMPEMRDRFTQPTTLAAQIDLIKSKPLDFAPGSRSRYGNSGFILSAHLIEQLGGVSYAQFLERRIYRPLGMSGSGYSEDGRIIHERARGYVSRDGEVRNAGFIDMSIPIGAGSQFSTVRDLLLWDRALRDGSLLSAASLRRMFASNAAGYGLGWEVGREQGRTVIQHNGDINGFGAFIARYADDDAVIIILSNMEGTRVRTMKDAIAAALFRAD